MNDTKKFKVRFNRYPWQLPQACITTAATVCALVGMISPSTLGLKHPIHGLEAIMFAIWSLLLWTAIIRGRKSK